MLNPMANLSFFVSSTTCYVSLLTSDHHYRERLLLDGRTQASVLIPFIQSVWNKAGAPLLSQINVPKGPGSFTSLRVTLAAAQGLSLAFPNAICYAPTFFDVLLYDHPVNSYAVIDSKRGDFFVKRQKSEPVILTADAFTEFQMMHHDRYMIVDPDLIDSFPNAVSYDPIVLLDALSAAATFIPPSDFSPYYLVEPAYKKTNDSSA
jgi:tRNA A37 threonylcarbamoyladenosine modification protein TsaB